MIAVLVVQSLRFADAQGVTRLQCKILQNVSLTTQELFMYVPILICCIFVFSILNDPMRGEDGTSIVTSRPNRVFPVSDISLARTILPEPINSLMEGRVYLQTTTYSIPLGGSRDILVVSSAVIVASVPFDSRHAKSKPPPICFVQPRLRLAERFVRHRPTSARPIARRMVSKP